MKNDPGTPETAKSRPRRVKCPGCGGRATWEGNPQRPFCSLRCRLSDLGAWLDERYRVPGAELPSDTDDVP